MEVLVFLISINFIIIHDVTAKLVSQQTAYASPGLHWLPSRINSIYSHVGPWSNKFRPVMDDLESDEALRFYNFLNYLDGASFGTGPFEEFIEAMNRLASNVQKQLARQAFARGPKELEAILAKNGNSIKQVLDSSTVITRRGRTFFCTGEVKEPIVDNKIICKDRLLLPIAGTSCRDAVKYWHSELTEEHYCVGAMEYGAPVSIMDHGALFCNGDDYSKREYLLACDFYQDQESPTATLLKYYSD